jgi:putative lipoprotein
MIARLLSRGILVTLALTIGACAAPRLSETVADAAAAPLVNTDWRLTRLGERILDNPPGANAVRLRLQAGNPRITGFAGCNRLFGGYLLDGSQLKFAQVGATRMACLDPSRMQLESDVFEMLTQVSGWKIDGRALQLLDSGGATLATFLAGEPGSAP